MIESKKAVVRAINSPSKRSSHGLQTRATDKRSYTARSGALRVMCIPTLTERGTAMSARRLNIARTAALLVAALALSVGLSRADDSKDGAENAAAKDKPAAKDKASWRSLFDGKTLAGWKTTKFGAHAEPEVKDGQLVLPA